MTLTTPPMTRQTMPRAQAKAAGGCRRMPRACRLIRMRNGQSSTRPKRPCPQREPRPETLMRRTERVHWTLLRARLRLMPRTPSLLTANQPPSPLRPRALTANLPANRVISPLENPLENRATRALERALASLATRAPERALENLWANLSTERAPRARREQRDRRVPWTRRRRLPAIVGW